jgi:hypothetical protein
VEDQVLQAEGESVLCEVILQDELR